jgi:RNA polymerase sigma factor (sigma-70 family)
VDEGSATAPDIPSGRPRDPVTVPEPAHADAAQVEFVTCYLTEMPVLVRFLIICGAGDHDAADAAQDAFIELFQKWHTVRRPKQWLRTVAFRKFLQRPVTVRSPLEACNDSSATLPASVYIELDEEEKAVVAACRGLPMTQRQVFALHYDGFTIREISGMLAMREDAVRQNLARARARLKDHLGLGS